MAKRASSNIRNGKSTPRYNEEFKRDAVALWHTSGRSIVSVARELGISDVTLGTWIKKAKRAGAQPLTAEEEADKKEEIWPSPHLPDTSLCNITLTLQVF